MPKNASSALTLAALVTGAALLFAGCSAATPAPTPTRIPSPAPTAAPSPTPTAALPLPSIMGVQLDQTELPRYTSLDMTVALTAQQVNPYDARLIRLDALFIGPDGKSMAVPGFWNGKDAWHVRFTPSQAGTWNYQVVVTDAGGSSAPAQGNFNVTPSDLHGWIEPGDKVDPSYSSRYLAYQDGTPFYGVGFAEALNILEGGYDLNRGLPVLSNARDANENYVVWWPLYSSSPISNSYSQYNSANMDVMDLVVRDAQKKHVLLIFTVWDHPELRDATHAWGPGNWQMNGFSKLGDLKSFFTSREAWAWQQNLYRYMIARWGYSPAIGMWQTVSEINGTNAYDQTDPWHEKVNAYFQANDPYHHPTTASMSGDTSWPAGHKLMDAPQVHVYDFKNGDLKIDDTHAATVLAHWTEEMWSEAAKPNWVGEFGVPGDQDYPELFHNSIWAALASGAAMTPAEWNGGGAWGEMTSAMNADMGRLAQFVADIPLVKLNPSPLQITSSDAQVRGWGVAGKDGGLFWMQDFSLEGKTVDVIRKDKTVRKGVVAQLQGLAAGTYTVTPYDTWQGKHLTSFQVTCQDGQSCAIKLPPFHADLAFKLERK